VKHLIRVLLVEDSAVDAELMLHALRRAGFDLDARQAKTEPEFVEQLAAGVDVVISDSTLPRFSGLRALELRNQSGLDVPFILISGFLDEGVAAEATKNGASDFLLKDRLIQLGAAVEHALNECRLRREKVERVGRREP
jgi:DNA-binding NtrC family response regulator